MAVTALVLPISGPYTGTWQANLLGTQNDDGFVLSGTWTGQEINATDAFGMTLVDAIYRGLNWKLRFRGMEFNRPGILAALQAFGGGVAPTTTNFSPTLANIGDRYSRFAQALVLTSILGVQAQGSAFGTSANPAYISTLTANGSIISPQSNSEFLFTSKVREAPLEFVLLPYAVTVGSLSVNASFTTT